MEKPVKHDKIRSTRDIEAQIRKLTADIQSATQNSLFTPSETLKPKPLPQEILLEIHTKRALRRQWQHTLDPKIKTMYNAQIQYVKDLLTTHKQEEWDRFTENLNF